MEALEMIKHGESIDLQGKMKNIMIFSIFWYSQGTHCTIFL